METIEILHNGFYFRPNSFEKVKSKLYIAALQTAHLKQERNVI